MKIRAYRPADLQEIASLFYDTVHTVNAADYRPEQLEAWADGHPDLEAWGTSFVEHDTVVAEEDGILAGFGDMAADGYLDRLYVRKDYQGRGIATAICSRLEKANGSGTFMTHASVTARPFFERRGYKVIKEQQVERKGQVLTNYVMEKGERNMKIPRLETERLILRRLVPDDAEEAYRNWTSDPEVARFMRWNTHQDPAETRAWIESEQEGMDKGEIYDWGFISKETGKLIGSGGFFFSEEQGMCELGYNIMKKYWGQGLTSEAAKKIIEFAVNDLGLKKLYGCHAMDNPASGGVLRKAGFRFVKDGSYKSWDGKKEFTCKEYLYTKRL